MSKNTKCGARVSGMGRAVTPFSMVNLSVPRDMLLQLVRDSEWGHTADRNPILCAITELDKSVFDNSNSEYQISIFIEKV